MVNCCGGSLSTLGNMKRPVAARHPAVAAVNAPHDSPSQPRRDINGGEVSSGARDGFAGALPAAALVVLRASAGFGAAGAAAPDAGAT